MESLGPASIEGAPGRRPEERDILAVAIRTAADESARDTAGDFVWRISALCQAVLLERGEEPTARGRMAWLEAKLDATIRLARTRGRNIAANLLVSPRNTAISMPVGYRRDHYIITEDFADVAVVVASSIREIYDQAETARASGGAGRQPRRRCPPSVRSRDDKAGVRAKELDLPRQTLRSLDLLADSGNWKGVRTLLRIRRTVLAEAADPSIAAAVSGLRARLGPALAHEAEFGAGSLLVQDHPFNLNVARIRSFLKFTDPA